MSAKPVFSLNLWSHAELTERVGQLALDDQRDSFEWHCLDQEVLRRLIEDYAERPPSGTPAGGFHPVLVEGGG